MKGKLWPNVPITVSLLSKLIKRSEHSCHGGSHLSLLFNPKDKVNCAMSKDKVLNSSDNWIPIFRQRTRVGKVMPGSYLSLEIKVE